MVLLSVIVYLVLNGIATTTKIKGNFHCTKPPKECTDCVEWNGSLYNFINTTQSYENSSMICQHKSNDTHLVYIESKEENEFVTRMLATFGSRVTPWIGLSDGKSEGNWTWGNHRAEYFNWDHGEPNGERGENNVIINLVHDGKWYDVPPGWHCPTVCEKKLHAR
ncbi:Aggrecan core protein [Holothuria leucospilota]|uniref:Aggrecan core protein n=1 Tax=Holothuria leucospilota TaxID=206669 RepID=A0A9Q0YNK4_HOLLE|nr:Aggrecan core protein [Holothuria leucospilota]